MALTRLYHLVNRGFFSKECQDELPFEQALEMNPAEAETEDEYWRIMNLKREAAEKAKDPEDAVLVAPWFDKPHILSVWWDKMTHEQKVCTLFYVWSYMEFIEPFGGYEWWLHRLKELGYIPHERIEKPTEPVRIYRGCNPEYKLGMSWTPDPFIAQVFSKRGRNPLARKVYTTIINPNQILGIVNGQIEIEAGGETTYSVEYIIDYQSLEEGSIEEYCYQ